MIRLPSPYNGKVVKLYVNALDQVVARNTLVEIELESAAMASDAELAARQRNPDVGWGEQRMSSNNRDRLDAGGSAAARAAPAVRSLAKKLGVDLEKCVGTGRDGTITMNDVIARTNQAKANRADRSPARPSQPAWRSSEPADATPTPAPARPTVNSPVGSPTATPPPGWMSEFEAPASTAEEPPPAWEPQSARSWATMEEELPPQQPDPRNVAAQLQELSAYDFPSAERQPTEAQSDPNDPYAQRTSWFATSETSTEENIDSDQEPMQSDLEPDQPTQALNPWGAIEAEEEQDQGTEQAQYETPYDAQASELDAVEEAQAEQYVELASEAPTEEESLQSADESVDPDWQASLTEGDEAAPADDLNQYEPAAEPELEANDAAVTTSAYEAEAPQAAMQSDLTADEDWVKPASLAPQTPEEWAHPEYAYANTANSSEARSVPLRTPYLDMTPRTLVDQEDRLQGLRRNMVLNMTRARDEVATCTMFDDADLNAWPNFNHITVRLLRAIVAGIRVEPGFNATFDPAGPSRRLLRQINVAVSVDTREGLTVPVLRDIGSRSMDDLREYVYHMKERTLTRNLSPEDLRDFSFSLANYGIFAGRYATPPVIPPTVATLGCGRLERAVVAGESEPEIHAMLPLSLAFDHRCVTMGEACRFLAALKLDLELPE